MCRESATQNGCGDMRVRLAACVVFAACVSAPAAAVAQDFVYDPYESFNRRMFAVHEAIDHAVLEPVARGYRSVAPEPVRNGVTNFLRNLRSPIVFANDLLQGEPDRAGTTLMRFSLNSTVGLLGVMDPATDFGFERHDEDFGQTLGAWGVGEGPYLFIPVLGPTNLRDGAGRFVDMAFDPINYAEFDGDSAFRVTRGVATGVSAREAVIEEVEDIRRNSVDPYASMRNTYGLWRTSAVRNGRRDVQDLPEFEEIPEAWGEEPALDAPPEAIPPEIEDPAAVEEKPAQDRPEDAVLFRAGVKT